MKRFSSLAFLVPLALSASLRVDLAAAAPPEPTASEISVARRLFDEGKAAEDAGRYREAADKFRKAIAIKDTPGIRFHLARCEEEQGALVEALLEYDRAGELLDSGVKAADVARLLPEARARVRSKVASLTLRLPEGVNEVSVELDGKPLSTSVLGVPIPVNPGKHRLRAAAGGRKTFSAEVELGVGEAKQLPIELPTDASSPTPPPPEAPAPVATGRTLSTREPPTSDTLRTVTLVGEASLFAAALTSGIVFTIAKGSAGERYDAANARILEQHGPDPDGTACAMPLEGCAQLEDARRDEQRNSTLATVGFVTAGASALAFGLTLVLWKTEPPARVQAGIGPDRASLVVTTRF